MYIHESYAHYYQKDRISNYHDLADRERLVQQARAQANGQKRQNWPALIWLGERLVGAGKSLKDKAGANSNSIPALETCE